MSQRAWELWASVASVAVAIVVGVIARVWPGWVTVVGRFGRAVAGRRLVAGVAVAGLSFVVNALVALHHGVPRPVIQDEYGYLLAADTFARGRVTNPPVPFPEHFETPHVLVRPTYASKYPPGQGVALAVGQVAAGLPIVGVWLATAAAVAAAYWMLLAFVPAGWAAVGAAVLALHPTVLQWNQTYWGGSVALLGGTALLGGWGRLSAATQKNEHYGNLSNKPSKKVSHSVAFVASRTAGAWWSAGRGRPAAGRTATGAGVAIGLSILAASRPYEGAAFAVILVVGIAVRVRPGRWVAGGAAVLAVAVAALLYYDWRVTGHVLRPPIVEYARQYDVYPKFWFLPKHADPGYANAEQAWVHRTFEAGEYDALRTPAGLIRIGGGRLWQLLAIHARPAVVWLPMALGFAVAVRDRRLRWVVGAIGGMLAGLWSETFFLPHYAAPATAAFLLLTVVGWRRLAGRWPAVAVAIGAGYLACAAVLLAAPADPDAAVSNPQLLADAHPDLQEGRHVVFVRYPLGHDPNNSWVYNSADLASQRVIFARYFGPAADAPVARAFGDRRAWLLTVGVDMVPYPWGQR